MTDQRIVLLQKCRTLQKLVLKKKKQHDSFHKYLRSILITHTQSLPNDIIMVSFLSESHDSLIQTLHKICDEIPSSVFCNDANDLSEYFLTKKSLNNEKKSFVVMKSHHVTITRIQKFIDSVFPKSDLITAPPPFSDQEFSIENQDLIIIHDILLWREWGKQWMNHPNITWGECIYRIQMNQTKDAVIAEMWDHVEKIGINRNFMGKNPSSDILSFVFKEWDGLYRSLESFIQKNEWNIGKKFETPQELSNSISKFVSSDDVKDCYSRFKKMQSFDRKPFLDYLYDFQKEFYSHKLQLLSKNTDNNRIRQTYSYRIPLYTYYDFLFGSCPIVITENTNKLLLCDNHGKPTKYFKHHFQKKLFPVRSNNKEWDWMWKDDSLSVFLNIFDHTKKRINPSVYLSRVHMIYPGWTFFRMGGDDVRFFWCSDHHILPIHRAQMNWRLYSCKDMDISTIKRFCVQKLENGSRYWFKNPNIFQSLLEKMIPCLEIGELLDRCTEAQLIMDPRSPFFIYFHDQKQEKDILYSRVIEILSVSVTNTPPFFDHDRRNFIEHMHKYFLCWDLLSPNFQSYIIKIWNIDACLETYQQFFMNNRDTFICSDEFQLLPSDLDWIRMLRHGTDVCASSHRLLKPSSFNHPQNIVLRKHFHSLRYCPSFSRSIIIDSCNEDEDGYEEDEEWTETRDVCDIDEENDNIYD